MGEHARQGKRTATPWEGVADGQWQSVNGRGDPVAAFVAAVRALDAAFVRHADAGELGQLVAACYADDALVLPPHLPLVQGHGQIRELLRELLEGGAGGLERDGVPLHAAGAFGYGVGRYTCVVGQPGGAAVQDSGKYVLVYRRQADGAWKIALDMFNSDLPAAGIRRR